MRTTPIVPQGDGLGPFCSDGWNSGTASIAWKFPSGFPPGVGLRNPVLLC